MSDISTCYHQAQALMQGVLSKKLVLNDAVFPHWIGDTECFWYERETRQGREYRLVDAQAGSNQLAFDFLALVKALENSSGQSINDNNPEILVVNIVLSPRQINFTALDKQWVFEPDKGSCQEVELIPAVQGLLSHDGKRVVFVREHNLWLRELASDKERALTLDGTVDTPYGTAAAPFGGPYSPVVQAQWSPDSQTLLTHRLDVRNVASRSIVNHVPQDGSLRPQLLEYYSAYPGDKNSETLCLLAIDIKSGEVRPANYEPLTLSRSGAGFFTEDRLGWWSNDSRRAYFIDVTRGAKTVMVVEWTIKTGATRILLDETSDTSVKLSYGVLEQPLFVPLPDSNELIWFSERNGWGHLYLYDLGTGTLKHPITQGEWLVREVLHVDTERRELWLHTAGRDPDISPYYREVSRLNIDTGEIISVASGNYDHRVFDDKSKEVQVRRAFCLDTSGVNGISISGNYLVITRSRVDTVPVSLLIDRDGKEVMILETADPFGLLDSWHWPEPVKLIAADGQTDIYGVIYRPPGFSPEQSYPVLDFSCGYPGWSYVPHSSFINDAFMGEAYLLGAAYAALGFIVVAIEGRGTPYRHKAFQDKSYGSITAANAFDDRISGLHQLAERYPYIDLSRIGLVGCDGISGPLWGLLQHPEFYKVGVVSGLQDSRFEIASLTEMYEDMTSTANTVHAEELVSRLKGKLLLTHGMADAVTPVAGTFRLIDALQKANKDFDLILLPNDGHEISNYVHRRSWDYLVTHLLGLVPPKEFKLTSSLDRSLGCD